MSQQVSRYFLPVNFSDAFQKLKRGPSAYSKETYEGVQLEYLVETIIDDENTDLTKGWQYVDNSWNNSRKEANDIVFFDTTNTDFLPKKEFSVVRTNPNYQSDEDLIQDASYKTLKQTNLTYTDFIPEYSEVMQCRLFVPKNNIAAWGEKEQYIINVYLNWNGRRIYLSSCLSDYYTFHANDYKRIDNEIYTQYFEFNVLSPYAICEDEEWAEFRKNVLFIDNIINNAQVSFEIIPYSEIVTDDKTKEEYIYINYSFNQANYTWVSSNNPFFLTLSASLNKDKLNLQILYPDTYLSLNHYLNNFKFYHTDNENANVSYDIYLMVYDLEGNVYWGYIDDESPADEIEKYIVYKYDTDPAVNGNQASENPLTIEMVDWLRLPVFESWDNFTEGMVLRAVMRVHSKVGLSNSKQLTYPDIEILSNKIPLTRDVFKYLVWNDKYRISQIDMNSIEMDNLTLNITNYNKKEEIVLANPTQSAAVRPVFFRAEILPTIKLNKILENISLNLLDYINRVNYFKLSINGNIIKESGRSGSNVIFAIPGDKIWSQLRESGEINTFDEVNNVYLLSDTGDVITTGKYKFR